MQFDAGDRLGRYAIVKLLGAGGMGEVYRAHDTELRREVALKVLPAEFAEDVNRAQRFEREARSIARLDHPNLLAIHDIGRHGGTLFLVCELLEGQELRERLNTGPLTLRETLDHATQIASGLAAAHREGVVHRDLKPANLFITVDGRLKILDFGLAKLVEPAEGGKQRSSLTAITEEGAVMGTVGYMAPEQIAGSEGDHRMDQFTLGIILYEMLTGASPFQRETGPETLTAILREDPEPLERVAPHVSAPLRWIVERCLARDPSERYDSTGDLAKDLETLAGRIAEVDASASARDDRRSGARSSHLNVIAAIIVAVAGAACAYLLGQSRDGESQIAYTRITFRRGTVASARFDPAGDGVLYSARWEGRASQIHLYRPRDSDAIAVGPPGARLISVSDRGELLLLTGSTSVGPFHKAGQLSRMPVTGAPRAIAADVTDAAFGLDGELAALVYEREERAVLEFPPGRERLSTRGFVRDLRLSPGGDQLAFAVVPQRGHEWGEIVVLDHGEGELRLERRSGRGMAWSPSGEEIWFVNDSDESSIDAISLDGQVRHVATFPTKVFLFDIDPAGRLLLATEQRRYEMAGRREGGELRDLSWLAWSVPFDVSADGEHILFNEYAGRQDSRVALRGFGPEAPMVLSSSDFGIDLSPDGEWVLSIAPWNPSELVLISTRTEERRTFALDGLEQTSIAKWLPGSEAVLFNGNAPGERDRIFQLSLSGGAPVAVTPEGTRFGFFAVSPDGTFVAAPHVRGDIAVYPLAGGEPTMFELGEYPIRWSADGGALYTATIGDAPGTIHRIDMGDGTVELIATLAPLDSTGVELVGPIAITPDGETYVYGYLRRLSTLQVVEGLR